MVSSKMNRIMREEAELIEGFEDEIQRCPVTGKEDKKSSVKSNLNKKKLTKFEMDEIFLDF